MPELISAAFATIKKNNLYIIKALIEFHTLEAALRSHQQFHGKLIDKGQCRPDRQISQLPVIGFVG
jgi:hypothetical protein